MATVIDHLQYIMSLEDSRFKRGMASAEKSVKGFGGTIQSLHSGLASVQIAADGLSAVAGAFIGFGQSAFNAAADTEKLMASLEAVTGSAGEAELQMARLMEVAKLPGLGLEEAIEASVNLQAVGFSADQAEDSIKAFGNALATVGKGREDLKGVVLALTQMQAKGKIAAEEINQIAERVPQIRAVMQEAFGTAVSEDLQKMGISASDFIRRVTDELGKLPPVAGGAANAMENLGDTAKLAMSRIGRLILPGVVDAVGVLAGTIDGLNASMETQSERALRFSLSFQDMAEVFIQNEERLAGLVEEYEALQEVLKDVATDAEKTRDIHDDIDGVIRKLVTIAPILTAGWDKEKHAIEGLNDLLGENLRLRKIALQGKWSEGVKEFAESYANLTTEIKKNQEVLEVLQKVHADPDEALRDKAWRRGGLISHSLSAEGMRMNVRRPPGRPDLGLAAYEADVQHFGDAALGPLEAVTAAVGLLKEEAGDLLPDLLERGLNSANIAIQQSAGRLAGMLVSLREYQARGADVSAVFGGKTEEEFIKAYNKLLGGLVGEDPLVVKVDSRPLAAKLSKDVVDAMRDAARIGEESALDILNAELDALDKTLEANKVTAAELEGIYRDVADTRIGLEKEIAGARAKVLENDVDKAMLEAGLRARKAALEGGNKAAEDAAEDELHAKLDALNKILQANKVTAGELINLHTGIAEKKIKLEEDIAAAKEKLESKGTAAEAAKKREIEDVAIKAAADARLRMQDLINKGGQQTALDILNAELDALNTSMAAKGVAADELIGLHNRVARVRIGLIREIRAETEAASNEERGAVEKAVMTAANEARLRTRSGPSTIISPDRAVLLAVDAELAAHNVGVDDLIGKYSRLAKFRLDLIDEIRAAEKAASEEKRSEEEEAAQKEKEDMEDIADFENKIKDIQNEIRAGQTPGTRRRLETLNVLAKEWEKLNTIVLSGSESLDARFRALKGSISDAFDMTPFMGIFGFGFGDDLGEASLAVVGLDGKLKGIGETLGQLEPIAKKGFGQMKEDVAEFAGQMADVFREIPTTASDAFNETVTVVTESLDLIEAIAKGNLAEIFKGGMALGERMLGWFGVHFEGAIDRAKAKYIDALRKLSLKAQEDIKGVWKADPTRLELPPHIMELRDKDHDEFMRQAIEWYDLPLPIIEANLAEQKRHMIQMASEAAEGVEDPLRISGGRLGDAFLEGLRDNLLGGEIGEIQMDLERQMEDFFATAIAEAVAFDKGFDRMAEALRHQMQIILEDGIITTVERAYIRRIQAGITNRIDEAQALSQQLARDFQIDPDLLGDPEDAKKKEEKEPQPTQSGIAVAIKKITFRQADDLAVALRGGQASMAQTAMNTERTATVLEMHLPSIEERLTMIEGGIGARTADAINGTPSPSTVFSNRRQAKPRHALN